MYSCDYHYFDEIDTPDKAYWLGFLMADGCVMHQRRLRHLKTMDKLARQIYYKTGRVAGRRRAPCEVFAVHFKYASYSSLQNIFISYTLLPRYD